MPQGCCFGHESYRFDALLPERNNKCEYEQPPCLHIGLLVLESVHYIRERERCRWFPGPRQQPQPPCASPRSPGRIITMLLSCHAERLP